MINIHKLCHYIKLCSKLDTNPSRVRPKMFWVSSSKLYLLMPWLQAMPLRHQHDWIGLDLFNYDICPSRHQQGQNWLHAANSCCQWINSLGPSDAIRHWISWSTLVQVMACCLTAPSHYLNQCLLIIIKVLWHSSDDIIIRRFEDTNQYSKIED